MSALARMKAAAVARRNAALAATEKKLAATQTAIDTIKETAHETPAPAAPAAPANVTSITEARDTNRQSPETSGMGSTMPASTTTNSDARSRLDRTSTADDALVAQEAPPEQLSKNDVTYDDLNTEQQAAIKLALEGVSFCLIGAAGTGKTTTVRMLINAMLQSGMIKRTDDDDALTKFFKRKKQLRVAIVSFTNQAVRNIRGSLEGELKDATSTVHKLVEFAPVQYDEELQEGDEGYEEGMELTVSKQIFAPKFGTLWNQAGGEILPHFDLIVVEESGSVALELFELLWSALPKPDVTQWLFLGDLNQLPPVFDDAILGFKQLELPTIELVQTYRNVGIITKLAHRVLEGRPITDKEAERLSVVDEETGDSIKFVKFQKKMTDLEATKQLGTWLKRAIVAEQFDPDETMVLIPFNVNFGTVELNKYIMQGITERDNLDCYEVITRFGNTYWAVGDKVLHDKMHYSIESIEPNPLYEGKKAIKPSPYLTRFGTALKGKKDEVFGDVEEYVDIDTSMEDVLNSTMESLKQDTGNQASHIITLVGHELGNTVVCRTNNINNLLPTYALTVHKAQGSEAKSVLFILHHSHAVAACREIFYTGLTRARKHLTVMYSGNYTNSALKHDTSMLHKCLVNQKIKGRTVEEKLKYFKLKARSYLVGGEDTPMRHRLVKLKEAGKI